MWAGFEPALVLYVNAMLMEWSRRGKNNQLPSHRSRAGPRRMPRLMPPRMGCEVLHSYHRHALMQAAGSLRTVL